MYTKTITSFSLSCLCVAALAMWASPVKAFDATQESPPEASEDAPKCFKIKMRNWQMLGPNTLLVGARKKVFYIMTLKDQCFTPTVSDIKIKQITKPDRVCAGYKDYIYPIYRTNDSPPAFDIKTKCRIMSIEKTDEAGVDRLFKSPE